MNRQTTNNMDHSQVSSKTWELSLYELHRTPHEIKTDDVEINVSSRSLHSELMCPICLDILKNTMTTKECLHRFCQECIITALRSGNKECPTCRKKLISKRSLQPDPNFDALISKIFPGNEEPEVQQEQFLARIKHPVNTNCMADYVNEGSPAQNIIHMQRSWKLVQGNSVEDMSAGNDPTSGVCSSAKGKLLKSSGDARMDGFSTCGTSYSNEIEIIMKPHPDALESADADPYTRFLKTTSNATVEHMAKYLAMRTALESGGPTKASYAGRTDIEFIVFGSSSAGGSLCQLAGSLSLDEVNKRQGKSGRPLELFYKFVAHSS